MKAYRNLLFRALSLQTGFLVVALSLAMPLSASAQVQLTPGQLDQIVSRVALYPDPLLARVLPAATYSDQIPGAAKWADQHSYLASEELAGAITADNLPWDPSVLALLPFPSVLHMMGTNLFWTRQLGDAVLAQKSDVMDAVQTMRQTARRFGYLQDGPQYRVTASGPGTIEIRPADPSVYYLPIYDPLVVFGVPRAGLVLGISFGPRVVLGTAFAPWGWSHSGFEWASRTILVDGHPWVRTSANYETYNHPYAAPQAQAGPRVERHELRPTYPDRKRSRLVNDR